MNKTIKVKCLSLENKNDNSPHHNGRSRRYSVELIKNAIENAQTLIDSRRFFALDKYPSASMFYISDIMGVVTKLEVVDLSLYATIEILDVKTAHTFFQILDAVGLDKSIDSLFGVTGLGTVNKKSGWVNDDFELLCVSAKSLTPTELMDI